MSINSDEGTLSEITSSDTSKLALTCIYLLNRSVHMLYT